MFLTYEIVLKCVVVMSNNILCKITDIRRVRINIFDRTIRTLDEVKLVPYLSKKLISLSTLDSKGYKYADEGRILKISKGAPVMLQDRESPNCMSCRVLQNLWIPIPIN